MSLRKLREAGYFKLLGSQCLSAGSEFLLESLTKLSVALAFPGQAASFGLAISTLANASPRILVQGFAGRVADHYQRISVMRFSVSLRLAAAFVLLALSFSLADHGRVLAVLAVLCSVVTITAAQFFNSSRASLAQMIIPEDARPEAASVMTLSLNGVGILAASLAPAWLAFAGFSGSVAVICLLEAAALLLLSYQVDAHRQTAFTLRGRTAQAREARPAGSRPRARTFWPNHRSLPAPAVDPVRMVFITCAVYSFAAGAVNQSLPLYLLRSHELPVSQYGLITGAFAAGGMLGAIAAAKVVRRHGGLRVLAGSALMIGAAYALFGALSGIGTLAITMVVLGVCVAFLMAAQGPILQAHVPNEIMGTVFGALTRFNTLAMLLGVGTALLATVSIQTLCAAHVGDAIHGYVISAAGLLLLIGGLTQARSNRPATLS